MPPSRGPRPPWPPRCSDERPAWNRHCLESVSPRFSTVGYAPSTRAIVAEMPKREEIVEAAGRKVTITNPDKVFFPDAGHTKLDLVRYYVAVADGALRGAGGRPMALKRYVNGAEGEFFFQKRAPEGRPLWIETVELKFPSGRTAREVVLRDAAQLVWIVNLGCIDLHPHPVRADDLEHPDELRVDLDPVPGVPWDGVRKVALVVRDVLADHGLVGWPKTSGSRGIHIWVRIQPRWEFGEGGRLRGGRGASGGKARVGGVGRRAGPAAFPKAGGRADPRGAEPQEGRAQAEGAGHHHLQSKSKGRRTGRAGALEGAASR